MPRRKFLVVLPGLLPMLAVTGAVARPADGPRCEALSGKAIAPHMTVVSAAYAGQGGTVGNVRVDAPFCRVVGQAMPVPDSRIGFEVWLPPAAGWNGKFQAVGSGSSAGAISIPAMLVALKAGYAAMSTDNGHLTDNSQPNGANEQTWALGHPQKILDFAYRALHLSTVAAKIVVAKFYGRKPEQSYFVGCSQGGHHALMEATRFPYDFNGIVAGAPGWRWANLMVAETWNSTPALRDPQAITPQSAALLNRAAIAACDKLDGVEDGVIGDPRRCSFDPGVLLCRDASPAGECLTPVQIAAAKRIYSGAASSGGVRYFQGYMRGSELGWPRLLTGPTPGGSSWDFWRYSVFQDKNFNNAGFNFDTDPPRAFATAVLGEPLQHVYNAVPDLHAFRAHGGKLIMYHGWADPQISPLSSLDFHRQIVAREGQAGTDGFLRLFMLGGIGHCQGGPGVGNFGGASPAAQPDARHDVVRALDAWVRKGKAPAMLIGTHITDGKPDRTRPLCAYPREARYDGRGDSNDARSFTCRMPLP